MVLEAMRISNSICVQSLGISCDSVHARTLDLEDSILPY